MKKMNLTFLKQQVTKTIFGCLFVLLGAFTASGQCSLACNGMTNISLDNSTSNCQAVITVGMVADTSGCMGGDLSVIVNDANGNPIPNATITSEYIGQTLEVVVLDAVTNNSCWGSILIEDKLPPVMDCSQAPDDITCFDLQSFVPVATDNCDTDLDIFKTKPDSVVINNCDDSTVSDDVLKTVFVTYIAVDDQGLASEECTFEFRVLRIDDFDEIEAPLNLLLQDDTQLECDSMYAKLPNGHPSPLDIIVGTDTLKGTGVPTLNDIDLFPNSFEDCNLLVTYNDTELPPIGCAIKIMRRWEIIEWSCSNPQRETTITQMIEIVDSEGPVITCPDDYTISTNGSSCEASVILPSIQAIDNCSPQSAITYGVSYGNGPALNTNGGLAQLALGENQVTYLVYDECLNLTSCTFTVTVVDNTPPVVICDQNTTVALTSDGCAYVNASVFDDGSYDECSDITLSVRRMDNGTPCAINSNCTMENDTLFDSFVRFCCIDQGADVMVVLRATDAEGNVNDCMVNVEVQDKLAPTLACPGPMSVDCDFPFDETNLSAAFGEFIVSDNCGNAQAVDVIDLSGLNQCNVGTAIRTISIGTPGTTGFVSCTQSIEFGAIDLFNDGVADSQPDTDIVWPTDPDPLDGCADPTGNAYLPENLPVGSQFPMYNEGACDLVGANYEDLVFPFNNPNGDACFKIIRTWTVIDWCQFITNSDGSTTYPSWTHTQIIKVNDTEGPSDIVTSGPSSVCTFDSDCADGFIELGATSTDNCTDVLDFAYTIFTDADNDGKLDDIVVLDGVVQSFTGAGNAIDASGTYPIGTHRVLYTFSDKCGNVTSTEFIFSIVNCKAPTAYCLNGLAVDLMEDGDGSGTVELWATDFDAGSSHPCGYEVYVSFDSIIVSENGNVDLGNGLKIVVNNGREFSCDDLGENFVNVWAGVVTPEGNVTQSFCVASLDVQDNQNICGDDDDNMRVEGTISTFNDVVLENAEVTLLGSELGAQMTDEFGIYAFPLMPMGGAYTVSPLKNDDYTNGVSTLDLVMIQRHVLDIEVINDPYKIIAADINNDEIISASDLLALRKLILGTITELPNNGSWRFIDGDFTFTDVTDPLADNLPESYDIEILNSDMKVDFVALKVGDINENATTSLTNEDATSTRSADNVTLSVNNQSYETGATVRVPMTISNATDMTGMQFTIETGASLEFVGIESEVMNISEHNIGFRNLSDGQVTISWNHPTGVSIADEAFELVFKSNTAGSLAKDLDLSSTLLRAELYNDNLETIDIAFAIEGREETIDKGFVLYQNSPNPFSLATEITFELPVSEAGTLTVFDMTGKIVKRIQKTFDKGYNQVTLTRSDLGAAGVLYYQLEVGEYNASSKMILID